MRISELRALEKIFAREIEGRLPFQSKAKIYLDLEKQGFVHKMGRVFGADGRFAVTVTGWALTPQGHYAYCSQCGSDKGGGVL